MEVGTAEAAPGELAEGWFDATGLPTGGEDRLPVVIANGTDDGPTLWVTGGVHGDEATGVAVVQDVVTTICEAVDLTTLAGTVVCVPIVNPAGLRRNERTSYYGGDDPNRYFPDVERDSERPPETQERIDTRLFETIKEEADLLIDCHTAQVGSVPFVIRDRVLYGQRRTEEEAERLADTLSRLVEAVGLPELREYPAGEYLEQSLQRSTAGATLNTAGIPAVTAELGGHSVVEEDARAAGVAAVFGTAVEFGLIDAQPSEVGVPGTGIPESPVSFPVHRYVGPRTETAGLVRHHLEAGDRVGEGDRVAEILTPHGDRVDIIEAEHDGYLLGRTEGLAVYEGDAIASMAVRDDGDLVVPRESEENG